MKIYKNLFKYHKNVVGMELFELVYPCSKNSVLNRLYQLSGEKKKEQI